MMMLKHYHRLADLKYLPICEADRVLYEKDGKVGHRYVRGDFVEDDDQGNSASAVGYGIARFMARLHDKALSTACVLVYPDSGIGLNRKQRRALGAGSARLPVYDFKTRNGKKGQFPLKMVRA